MQAEKNADGLYEVSVDGRNYEFEKWGAEDSLKTLLKIAKIAGEPLGLAIAAITGSDPGKKDAKSLLDKNIDADLLAKAFKSMTQSLDENVSFDLIKKLATGRMFCEKAQVKSFDVHYKDSLPHALHVAWANLQVQYGNFFQELLGAAETSAPQRAPISNLAR